MDAGGTGSADRCPLPSREQGRFRRRAIVTLVLVATLGGALAAYATASNRADFPPFVVVLGAVPFLGGAIGLRRLVAAWEAGPGRQHAVVAAFSLGLLFWSLAMVIYLVRRATGAQVLEFPDVIDVANYASAISWTVGVWLLYEGAVDDFLEELALNSYFVTWIVIGCFFALSLAEGEDFGSLLTSGTNLARYVTEGLLPLAWGVNGFLLYRATCGKLGKRLRADRKALQAMAFGLAVACVSDLLFAMGIVIYARDPANPRAYRNGGLSDVLALGTYFWLSFGLLHFPLDAPLHQRADA